MSRCLFCLALPNAMTPYRAHHLAAVAVQTARLSRYPVVVLLARALTPQTSQDMTSPVSAIPLATEAILPNSP